MFKDQIIEAVKEVYPDLVDPDSSIIDFNVGFTSDSKFGDYTCNVAMAVFQTSKGSIEGTRNHNRGALASSPIDLAGKFAEKLIDKLNNVFEKIEAAPPGFINFWLKKDALVDNLIEIDSIKEEYGSSDFLKDKRIVVEYTDPNPFKEFHVGHLYTNTVGESICRLLEGLGANVWRADYFGDVGMHVAKAIWGLMKKFDEDKININHLESKPLKERIEYFGKAYALGATAFEEDKDAVEDMKQLNFLIFKAAQEVVLPEFKEKAQVNYDQYIKSDNKYMYSEIKKIYSIGRKWSLEYFESIYSRVGMKFDGYYPESRTGEFGYGMVLDGLAKGIFEKGEKGAIIFPGEKYGLHNRVFINALNLPTYEAKDFGNSVVKYKDFPYDKSLIVTGNEINAYFVVVLKALGMYKKELSDATTHLGHGMVRLPEGKMSSRTGKIIRGEWVLDEAKKRALEIINKNSTFTDVDDSHKDQIAEQVAQGAVKYAFLKQGIGENIAFDFETSLSFDGNSGPYLQYTIARTNSVLAKMLNDKWQMINKAQIKDVPLDTQELIVLRLLSRFSEVIEASASTYSPNILCTYLYDLAQKFNSFYNADKIIDSENESFRLALTFGVGQVLKNGLNLLGIDSPERM